MRPVFVAVLFAFLLLFYSLSSCFAKSNYKNTISLSAARISMQGPAATAFGDCHWVIIP
jgi:ABC-type uncharacterized transport system auxiliary subunit